MSDLLALSMPWYEIVLRGALVYIVLLSLLRLSGKHEEAARRYEEERDVSRHPG